MSHSTFYSKPDILNKNYKPLKKEHSSLQYYFKEAFILMDHAFDPRMLLLGLLDKYLSLKNINKISGRVINQKKLAIEMKSKLENMPDQDAVLNAFQVLNKINHDVHPKDDLIYLLSVYCSLFPFMYPKIINKKIKDALIIRDINNIYLDTVLRKSLKYSADHNLLSINNKTIELAFITNQYEYLLQKFMNSMNVDTLSSFVNMDVLLKYATTQQVDAIVLPAVMAVLTSNKEVVVDLNKNKRKVFNHHVSTILYTLMPSILNKASVKSLETIIVPMLFKIYEQEDIPTTKEILLKCIEKMDCDALKRSFQPRLTSCIVYKGKNANYDELHVNVALELYVAMISKFSKEENDNISNGLIPIFQNNSKYWFDKFLIFLKELRHKQRYVNEKLFQVAFNVMLQANDDFLKSVENKSVRSYHELFVSHMTAEQVQHLFSMISFEVEFKNDSKSFLWMLMELAELSVDVYPMSLRRMTFEFIYSKCHSPKESITWLPALILYLRKCKLSDENSRKILINLSHFAAEKIQITNRYDESRILYCQLLETCTSLMTEQEIKYHIIPMIDIEKMRFTDYTQSMHGTLYQIFSKVNDGEVHAKFFLPVIYAFINSSFSECDDLLKLIINKIDPIMLIYTCRQLLKLNISNFSLDRVAYALTLFYEKNKGLFHSIPGFCTGEQYSEPSLDAKLSKIRKTLLTKS